MIHPVRDYDEFVQHFNESSAGRRARGIIRQWVHRAVDNPNEVMVTLELGSRVEAEALLAADDAVRGWFDRAGVDIYPAVFIGELDQHIVPAAGLRT